MAQDALTWTGRVYNFFREVDVQCMIAIGHFDLSKYEDVKSNGDAIYAKVKSKDMPKDGPPWTTDKVDEFKSWMDAGYPEGDPTWLGTIKGYFTDQDIACMRGGGNGTPENPGDGPVMDLGNYWDVRYADGAIYDQVKNGIMPMHGKKWDQYEGENRVEKFQHWMTHGWSYANEGVDPPPAPVINEPVALIGLPGVLETHVRLEWHDFVKNEFQKSLFLRAFRIMQDMDLSQDGEPQQFSWEAIARIHGEPEPWYCVHGAPEFPSWHRPFVMLFETAIRKVSGDLIQEEKDNEWTQAHTELRLPFWDWGLTINGVAAEAPDDYISEKIRVLKVGTTDVFEDMDNPLRGYTKKGTPISSDDRDVRTGTTVRYAPVGNYTPSEEGYKLMQQNFAETNPVFRTQMYNCINKPTDWPSFATTTSDQHGSKNADSMEIPHNIGHVVIGGGYPNKYSDLLGQMSENPVAGYEPLFFLHHTQVERMLCIWQEITNVYQPGNDEVIPFRLNNFEFAPGLDSDGNDIGEYPGLTVDELRAKCDELGGAGFNTNGWIKKSLLPRDKWTQFSPDPNAGFYYHPRVTDGIMKDYHNFGYTYPLIEAAKKSGVDLKKLFNATYNDAHWQFHQDLDSEGNDFGNFKDACPTIEALKQKCVELGGSGFNTNGWIKKTLNPENTWTYFSDDTKAGLYVFVENPDPPSVAIEASVRRVSELRGTFNINIHAAEQQEGKEQPLTSVDDETTYVGSASVFSGGLRCPNCRKHREALARIKVDLTDHVEKNGWNPEEPSNCWAAVYDVLEPDHKSLDTVMLQDAEWVYRKGGEEKRTPIQIGCMISKEKKSCHSS